MNVLMVCPQLPYPPVDGGRRGVFYPLKVLAERGHRIHLACLSDGDNPEAANALQKYCTLDMVVLSKGPTLPGAVRYLLSSTPYDAGRFHTDRLLELVLARVSAGHVDVIQVEGIHAAWYALKVREKHDVPIAQRVHAIQHMNLLRSVGRYRNPLLNLYLRLEGEKMRRYEAAVGRRFDVNLVISDVDREILLSLDPSIPCAVVPAGVDPAEFDPGSVTPDPLSVLWMGSLSWPPNRDSFWWFYREIVPRLVTAVPRVTIHVVGSNTPKEILAIRHPNLIVHGFVPELQSCLRKMMVCVVPLRVGSGIRIKLLEMFAMRKAIVSTRVGCEGLGVTDGEQLLVADDPDAFAAAVIRLLDDPALRDRLGVSGLEHVKRNFTWDQVGALWEKTLGEAATRCRQRTLRTP